MNRSGKTIEIKVERTIPAPPGEVFDGWLDPKIPGNPWNAAEKFILDPRVDGLFYWLLKGTAHYGRFTKVERPGRFRSCSACCCSVLPTRRFLATARNA